MPYLEVFVGDGEPRRYPIGYERLIIGSSPRSDIRIEDPSVSDEHAILSWELVARDPGNGAKLLYAGRHVSEQVLHLGDELRIGAGDGVRIRLQPGVAGPDSATLGWSPGEHADSQVADLRRRVRELENERVGLERSLSQLESQLAAPPASERQARLFDERMAQQWLDVLLGARAPEVGGEDGPTAAIAFARVEEILRQLYAFLTRIEAARQRILSDVGEHRRNTHPAGRPLETTLLEMLEQTPTQARNELQRQLRSTWSRWVSTVLIAYRRGVEAWSREHLDAISPAKLKQATSVPSWLLDLGGGHSKLWQNYERLFESMTPDMIVEQIDEAVLRAVPELGRWSSF